MCGICGIILDTTKEEIKEFDIGSLLVRMAYSQQVRGQDSFGMGIYNKPKENKINEDNYKVNVAVHSDFEFEVSNLFRNNINESPITYRLDSLFSTNSMLSCYEFDISNKSEPIMQELLRLKSEYDENFWIMSHGKYLTIVKDIGIVKNLANKWFDVDEKLNDLEFEKIPKSSYLTWNKIRYGTHGIAHVRIATNTEVEARNAHPICSLNLADISVVHNGEITNADNLRRELKLKGYDFTTTTDSEVIVAFIANRLIKNKDKTYSLKDACREFIESASGFYTGIVSTPNEVAFFSDILKTRPAVYGYHDKDEEFPAFYAIATDISALDSVNATKNIDTINSGEVKIFNVGLDYKIKKIQSDL